MRIAIASDHNAVSMKSRLSAWLTEQGHQVENRGVDTPAQIVDYPPLCADVGSRVVDGPADFGVILGGSGCGEGIAANKIHGVRAALCHCVFTAEIARAHNDANVLVMGAKVVAPDLAERILTVWLATAFKGGRHQQRVEQISALERGESLV
jgi:ribose 5-phosphate isomerase B